MLSETLTGVLGGLAVLTGATVWGSHYRHRADKASDEYRRVTEAQHELIAEREAEKRRSPTPYEARQQR